MRILLVGMILSLQGCALFLGHVVPARFVDGSEKSGAVFICVPDEDTRNPGGVMCADMVRVRQAQEQAAPEGPPANSM